MPIVIPSSGTVAASHLLIATPVLSDAATLTGLSTVTGFPVTRLQTHQLSEKWRSNSAAPWIDIDFGSAKTVNTLALIGTNAGAATSVRVRATDNHTDLLLNNVVPVDATYAHFPEADTSVMDTWDETLFVKRLAAPQTYRYWRTDIANPVANVYDAGRIYLALGYQPAIDALLNWSLGLEDPSTTTRARGGQRYGNRRKPWRVLTFTLRSEDAGEVWNTWFSWMRVFGITKDILVSVDPTSAYVHTLTMYGALRELNAPANIGYGLYECSFVVEELL